MLTAWGLRESNSFAGDGNRRNLDNSVLVFVSKKRCSNAAKCFEFSKSRSSKGKVFLMAKRGGRKSVFRIWLDTIRDDYRALKRFIWWGEL